MVGKWYFTFGSDQVHAGKVQPIVASGSNDARAKMFEMYGPAWCFQYSAAAWDDLLNRPDRWWAPEELPTVYTEEALADE